MANTDISIIKTDELVTAVSHENAEHYDKLYYFEKFYTQDAIPEGLAKLPSDVAQKKHALIFKNYFDRGAIRMYEYFNDYEKLGKSYGLAIIQYGIKNAAVFQIIHLHFSF